MAPDNRIARTAVHGYGDTVLAELIMLPPGLGEIGTCLWLLIISTRHRARQSPDAGTDKQWSSA